MLHKTLEVFTDILSHENLIQLESLRLNRLVGYLHLTVIRWIV